MSVQATTQPPPPLTAPLAPLRSSGTAASTILAPAPVHHHHPPPPPPPSPLTPVTLQAPRPDAERATNEYVETPFRATTQFHHAAPTDKGTTPIVPRHLERPARLPLPTTTGAQLHHLHQHQPVVQHQHHGTAAVTKQPVAFTKEHPAIVAAAAAAASSAGTGIGAGDCASSGNIICSECGRCRCESCRAPRPLPSRWVCDNACLCSADALIDYASCLCCVKGLYYHCSDTDAGATCADDPCSCGPHRRLARWACLGALTAALPCLLCYWPLRGCQRAVEAAYARHSRAGCRCRPHAPTPEKRLLDSSPEF